MPRPRATTPKRRLHLSGQSVVEIDGRTYYLGEHDSPKALARYLLLVAEYQKNELRLPEGFEVSHLDEKVQALLANEPIRMEQKPITIGELAIQYESFVKEACSKPHQKADLQRRLSLVTSLLEHDRTTLVDEFGPVKLQQYQKRFVESATMSRQYVNRMVNGIRSIFKWGISQELVRPEILLALKCVPPLRFEGSFESKRREAVSIDVVKKTLPHVGPIVRDLILVMLGTGARPSEICTMRPCDIDRTSDPWFYRPQNHKTKWKGILKEIPILGNTRIVVENYLNRPSDAFLFSPVESMNYFRSKQSLERKGKGSRKKPVENPKRKPRDCYSPMSLTKAIRSASKVAGVQPWTAYQIRHLVGTTVAEKLCLEDCKSLLGHQDVKTTQIYARSTREQSIRAAQHTPSFETWIASEVERAQALLPCKQNGSPIKFDLVIVHPNGTSELIGSNVPFQSAIAALRAFQAQQVDGAVLTLWSREFGAFPLVQEAEE